MSWSPISRILRWPDRKRGEPRARRLGTSAVPTPAGRIWHESNFRREVWIPALAAHFGIVRSEGESRSSFAARCRADIKASKRVIRPHECRYSWVTSLRAAGIDDADLAAVAGHTVETMIGTHTHPLGRSHDRIRKVIG
jgi:hypothetical protein